jgi:short-subunit dehydrogenase
MKQKTIIVTGASQGIGASIATLFLDRGYNVVGTSRHISSKNELRQSDHLALVDGDIGQTATAQQESRQLLSDSVRSMLW